MRIKFPGIDIATNEVVAGLDVVLKAQGISDLTLSTPVEQIGQPLLNPVVIVDLLDSVVPLIEAMAMLIGACAVYLRSKKGNCNSVSVMVRGTKGSFKLEIATHNELTSDNLDSIVQSVGAITELVFSETEGGRIS